MKQQVSQVVQNSTRDLRNQNECQGTPIVWDIFETNYTPNPDSIVPQLFETPIISLISVLFVNAVNSVSNMVIPLARAPPLPPNEDSPGTPANPNPPTINTWPGWTSLIASSADSHTLLFFGASRSVGVLYALTTARTRNLDAAVRWERATASGRVRTNGAISIWWGWGGWVILQAVRCVYVKLRGGWY